MNKIELTEQEIYEYLKETLNSLKLEEKEIYNSRYFYVTQYALLPLICEDKMIYDNKDLKIFTESNGRGHNLSKPEFVNISVSSNIDCKKVEGIDCDNMYTVKNIPFDKLTSIDIRLLELLEKNNIRRVANNFNYLIDALNIMDDNGLYLPVREMTDSNLLLDSDQLKNMPKIKIKN